MTAKLTTAQTAIEHLSSDMRRFHRAIARRFALSDHHRRLLVCACESHDRMTAARDLIAKDGLTTTDRHGQVKPHPAVSIERDSRTAFARMLRELALSDDVSDEVTRLPRPTGRYEGRS